VSEALRRAGRAWGELRKLGAGFQDEVRKGFEEPARASWGRSVSSVQTLLRPAVAIASQPAFWNRVVVGIDDQMLHVLLSLG
jgi:hypothetical protein